MSLKNIERLYKKFLHKLVQRALSYDLYGRNFAWWIFRINIGNWLERCEKFTFYFLNPYWKAAKIFQENSTNFSVHFFSSTVVIKINCDEARMLGLKKAIAKACLSPILPVKRSILGYQMQFYGGYQCTHKNKHHQKKSGSIWCSISVLESCMQQKAL